MGFFSRKFVVFVCRVRSYVGIVVMFVTKRKPPTARAFLERPQARFLHRAETEMCNAPDHVNRSSTW
jgi:hypothetical protein